MSTALTELRFPNPKHELAAKLQDPNLIEVIGSYCNSDIEPGAFAMAAMTEINDLPADTDRRSVWNSIVNCATLGLIPGKAYGHAFFVPLMNRTYKPAIRECNLWLGYKGYLELGYRSGWLAGITLEVVVGDEKFRRWNDRNGAQLEHEINPNRPLVIDPPTVVCSYCQYTTTSGYSDVVTIGGNQLRALRDKQGKVWNSNFIEMALKTPIRRASKRWRQTSSLANAVRLDEQLERNETQDALRETVIPDGKTITFEQGASDGERSD